MRGKRLPGKSMTREEAICRATEAMAEFGYHDCGRDCLESVHGFLGERLQSAELCSGQVYNQRIGDPYWLVRYQQLFLDQIPFRPTYREETFVVVDVVTGDAEVWSEL